MWSEGSGLFGLLILDDVLGVGELIVTNVSVTMKLENVKCLSVFVIKLPR